MKAKVNYDFTKLSDQVARLTRANKELMRFLIEDINWRDENREKLINIFAIIDPNFNSEQAKELTMALKQQAEARDKEIEETRKRKQQYMDEIEKVKARFNEMLSQIKGRLEFANGRYAIDNRGEILSKAKGWVPMCATIHYSYKGVFVHINRNVEFCISEMLEDYIDGETDFDDLREYPFTYAYAYKDYQEWMEEGDEEC